MAKIFRPSNRESKLLSKIESSKEHARRKAIIGVKDHLEPLSNAIAMKLIENNLIETTSKNNVEESIMKCLEEISYADGFDIDYKIAPFRNLVVNPHVITLYVTAFVIEQLIKSKDVIDIFGSDEDIYACINMQVIKFLPQ